MQILKSTQKKGEITLKTAKPRLSRAKKEELIAHLRAIKDLTGLKSTGYGCRRQSSPFHTVQIVLTSDKEEVTVLIQE